jgi:hypothetical protein
MSHDQTWLLFVALCVVGAACLYGSLAAATLVLLISGFQHAVKGGFRGQVAALISQPWHDLTRRQAGEWRAVADIQDGTALLSTQGIGRTDEAWSYAHRPV